MVASKRVYSSSFYFHYQPDDNIFGDSGEIAAAPAAPAIQRQTALKTVHFAKRDLYKLIPRNTEIALKHRNIL
jgi:hypothetical protein